MMNAAIQKFSDSSTGTVDHIASYLSVSAALKNLHAAPILGNVLNGVKDENDESESSDVGAEDPSVIWARNLGAHLAYAAHYTAFACGGTSSPILSRRHTPTTAAMRKRRLRNTTSVCGATAL